MLSMRLRLLPHVTKASRDFPPGMHSFLLSFSTSRSQTATQPFVGQKPVDPWKAARQR